MLTDLSLSHLECMAVTIADRIMLSVTRYIALNAANITLPTACLPQHLKHFTAKHKIIGLRKINKG
ncbi:hypothetical protein E2C01_077467 [Portunus trituberculatus]|uniref:Uncharacterized protein n=1 Tax=Portunus trituberculatus TaxID=210409 RepID=A0A5B7IMD6_PORTR|nr:hypothetical protein [Portunus trituberculatus]